MSIEPPTRTIRPSEHFYEAGTVVSVQWEEGRGYVAGVSTPLYERGRGQARRCLQRVCDEADRRGVKLDLIVMPLDAVTSIEGLHRLYYSLGFRGPSFSLCRQPIPFY